MNIPHIHAHYYYYFLENSQSILLIIIIIYKKVDFNDAANLTSSTATVVGSTFGLETNFTSFVVFEKNTNDSRSIITNECISNVCYVNMLCGLFTNVYVYTIVNIMTLNLYFF